ncbi:hypothetical protein BL250_14485 [Erwinia sp. OLTSP20]|uniref:OspG family effector kinase n=1 Tax=unclassified Erwinia TaxID=2622719 RepID=UPI000C184CF2|nr:MULTISPECIES: hypothetical protein [unclassified Erwinia]PIJ48254.1 hypothetical protein BV501_17875 [Erwinia sp. OAMSP11]PIJ68754.1 hypothetical protein BK416_16165 [Erwinia sp. OLSSP12]PIJ78929.1 hypothetical protein BLD47_16080 [Erwinia sp. OLCASP19]PIJ79539.1 hypothetical protein BLD46_16875 [Erwinia sp. OLMTSP26]PIJ81497.1 hypothetical protein BLD49_16485 [Erwinia sp. OLMDSP33]
MRKHTVFSHQDELQQITQLIEKTFIKENAYASRTNSGDMTERLNTATHAAHFLYLPYSQDDFRRAPVVAQGSIGTVRDIKNDLLLKEYNGIFNTQYTSRLVSAVLNTEGFNRYYGTGAGQLLYLDCGNGHARVACKMKKIPGIALDTALKNNNLPQLKAIADEISACNWPQRLATLLKEKGIEHNDINMGNILYSKENGFSLIDFDSASFLTAGNMLSQGQTETLRKNLQHQFNEVERALKNKGVLQSTVFPSHIHPAPLSQNKTEGSINMLTFKKNLKKRYKRQYGSNTQPRTDYEAAIDAARAGKCITSAAENSLIMEKNHSRRYREWMNITTDNFFSAYHAQHISQSGFLNFASINNRQINIHHTAYIHKTDNNNTLLVHINGPLLDLHFFKRNSRPQCWGGKNIYDISCGHTATINSYLFENRYVFYYTPGEYINAQFISPAGSTAMPVRTSCW